MSAHIGIPPGTFETQADVFYRCGKSSRQMPLPATLKPEDPAPSDGLNGETRDQFREKELDSQPRSNGRPRIRQDAYAAFGHIRRIAVSVTPSALPLFPSKVDGNPDPVPLFAASVRPSPRLLRPVAMIAGFLLAANSFCVQCLLTHL